MSPSIPDQIAVTFKKIGTHEIFELNVSTELTLPEFKSYVMTEARRLYNWHFFDIIEAGQPDAENGEKVDLTDNIKVIDRWPNYYTLAFYLRELPRIGFGRCPVCARENEPLVGMHFTCCHTMCTMCLSSSHETHGRCHLCRSPRTTRYST